MMKIKSILLLLTAALSLQADTVVYENNFETNGIQPNFDTSMATSNTNVGRYLGKFSGNTRQSATLTLTNLPPHKYVTVSFDVIVAMTWDGNGRGYLNTNDLSSYVPDSGIDIFKVTANSNTMVHTTFASHDLHFYRYQSYPGTFPQDVYRPGTGAVATNIGAAQWDLDWYWEQNPKEVQLPDSVLLSDALYHFEITFTNDTDTAVIDFRTFALAASEYQGDHDEWWGLDNVKVEVSNEETSTRPLTACKPDLYQEIRPRGATISDVIVVGEAGTELTIQSTTDVANWNTERVVNFNGFYKTAITMKTEVVTEPLPEGTLGAQSVQVKNSRFWRTIQKPRVRR
jgi:hypothetical protein